MYKNTIVNHYVIYINGNTLNDLIKIYNGKN